MLLFDLQLFAHKKGVSSTKNGRDSNAQRLGTKMHDGMIAKPGNIIVRQRGTHIHPGLNVRLGKDDTLFAVAEGKIHFERLGRDRRQVSVYPVENKELLYRILKKGGAIISEYPLGTRPEKMNFPARNRIISGMSKGVIVIEAKKKSGTLITVDFALEQGRDVYVIPGNINSVNSAGTNELIKQGAKLVTTYDEIEI